ncbi:MAG: YgfZ/GcvT domain-containing protein [Alphaproteobacteria bacterium]
MTGAVDTFRAPVCVAGGDRLGFLQGLMTQAITPQAAAVYGAILTPQGRVVHDALIVYTPDTVLVFVEKGRLGDAVTLLNRYRLRADVTLSTPPVALWRSPDLGPSTPFPDPRHPALGAVGWGPDTGTEGDLSWYHRARILHAVPEGALDMPVGEALPLDYGLDRCHGIAWDKGCYMGQEVTARMHYRTLVKKHLVTVALHHPDDTAALPPAFTDLRDADGHIQGLMASSLGTGQGAMGLALVKKDTLWPLYGDGVGVVPLPPRP